MQRLIKITRQDGCEDIVKIRRTEEEIYNYYREENFYDRSNQVVKIDFLESPLLSKFGGQFFGLKYLFVDYDNSGILR